MRNEKLEEIKLELLNHGFSNDIHTLALDFYIQNRDEGYYDLYHLIEDYQNYHKCILEQSTKILPNFDNISKKIKSILNGLSISNVEEVNDNCFHFRIVSDRYSMHYEIDLYICKFQLNNTKNNPFSDKIFLSDINEDTKYVIYCNGTSKNIEITSFDLAVAKIFASIVDHKELYKYMLMINLVKRNVSYPIYFDEISNFKLKVSGNGKVYELVDANDNKSFIEIRDNFIISRFKDPLWLLTNLYTKEKYVPQINPSSDFINFPKIIQYSDTGYLKEFLKINNYDDSYLYKLMFDKQGNEDDLIYFYDGHEINFKSVYEGTNTYKFTFDNGSYIIVPKNQISIASSPSAARILKK